MEKGDGPSMKVSTGVVGLDVIPNAREVLIQLYCEILQKLRDLKPSSDYRNLMETHIKKRVAVRLFYFYYYYYFFFSFVHIFLFFFPLCSFWSLR